MANQYNKILTTVNSVTSNYSFTPDLSKVIVIDTSNNRIGINTVNPQYEIDVYNGRIRTHILEVTGPIIGSATTSFNEGTVYDLSVISTANFNSQCIVNFNNTANNALNIFGGVIINKNLDVLHIEVSNNLLVLGDASINNMLEVSNNLLIKGDASINNILEVSNNLIVLGDASINNILEVSNNLIVLGDASINNILEVSNNLIVLGDASINNILEVSNNLILNGELHAPNIFIIDPRPIDDIAGKVQIKGDLEVLGNQTTIQSTIVDICDNRIRLNALTNILDAGIDVSINSTTKSFIYQFNDNAWNIDDASLNIDGSLEV